MNHSEFLLFLILILLLFCQLNTQEEDVIYNYKCGVDLHDYIPKIAESIPIDEKSPLYRRRLENVDKDGFKKFNIYLDLLNIEEEIKQYELTKYRNTFIDSMQKAINTLESLLKVKSNKYGYNFDDEEFLLSNITYWDKTKFGTEAKKKKINTYTLDIDLLILGRFGDNEEMGNGTLASAYTLFLQQYSGQPIVGIVNINRDVDFSKINSQNYFQSIIIHEFTHILGFSKYYFMNYFGYLLYAIDKYKEYHYYIGSKKVLEVGKKYFNCSECDGIELDNTGGDGTKISHWKSKILLGDYMNGNIYTEEQVISEFTLALLEDSGYYKANYYTGGLMRYGKNKGCNFLYSKCIYKYAVDPLFENEFHDSIYSEFHIDPSCSSGRQSRTYNIFWKYSYVPIQYRYFPNSYIGGYPAADYCPIPEKWALEEKKIFYVGSCTEKGSGEYGSQIAYKEEGNENFTFYKSETLEKITGEIYSDHSFCALSSLIKENENKYELFSKTVRSVCLEMFCSSKSLTIKIHENYILCPRAGGKIKVDGYGGFLLCPDYNLICTGTKMCNDMFDCVEKKSEIKNNSYFYDYNIKTSQNIEKALEEENDEENNYELSEDGLCPKFCKLCTEKNGCTKCKEDYAFVFDKETEKIKCVESKELNVGYFQKSENIYGECIDNCDLCFDDISCNNCSENYFYFNEKKCAKKVENCEKYNEDGICEKCEDGFAFFETVRDKCFDKNRFKSGFYTKDEGISYYNCFLNHNKYFNGCVDCKYNKDNNNVICIKCNDDNFDLKNNECIEKKNKKSNSSKIINYDTCLMLIFILFLF